MTELVSLVRDTMEKYHMVREGDHIAVGLSGGADSVCLLHVLFSLREERGLSLAAVHVHHGLRETALRDINVLLDKWKELGIIED